MAGYGKAMRGYGKACKVKRKNLASGTKPTVEISEELDIPKKFAKVTSKMMRRVGKNMKLANIGKLSNQEKRKLIKEMKDEPSDE
jgi:hypothetical protein